MRRQKTSKPGIYSRTLANGDKRYEVSYLDSTNRRVFKTVDGNLRDAENYLNTVKGRMYRGETVAPSKMTVSQLADVYIDSQVKLRDSTRRTYVDSINHQIKPRLGHVKVCDLNTDRVARMVADMTPDYAAWTIHGTLTPLSRMMAMAVRRGWAAQNPVKGLDKSERPSGFNRSMRILDRNEINLVLKNCPPASRLLLMTAVFTGLRQGELYRLTWEDVNFDLSQLRVTSSKTDSGVRTVAVPGFLLKSLASRALDSPSNATFHSGRISQAAWAGNARQDLKTAVTRSGIPHCRFHDLRHTFASILIGQGLDVTFVSQQMGHANPAITLKLYAKLFDPASRMDEARKALDLSFSGVVG